jgi:hypothetical protein
VLERAEPVLHMQIDDFAPRSAGPGFQRRRAGLSRQCGAALLVATFGALTARGILPGADSAAALFVAVIAAIAR